MKNPNIKATAINLAGALLFIATIGSLKFFSLLFPIVMYSITWQRFRKVFWEAYVSSIVALILVVFGSIFLISVTSFRNQTFMFIIRYIYSVF